MTKVHDTLTDLHLGTPLWFVLSARLLPLGIVSQFLSAGAALFIGAWDWQIHKAIGGALSLPIVVLCAGVLFIPRLRGFNWWAGLVFTLYIVQFALAAGANSLPLAFHPFNGTLLLMASLVLLAKLERRLTKSKT
ncbi:DUF6220 domain-containing protein [Brucella intermedia GD04153]|uniref:DUF6220 domain-containing protein n=1 Tax=Brucella intermedia GD04153 TaxID=2975438 RepID=A0AA42KSX7_9HYPH|nr:MULTISPECIES: DUF6220 domain-containing protein [Hyphomicrobiales]MDH0123892.1 DUF6220 domain-containing protein [Brucella intermedia GD04153]NSX86336.1 hypothetical protein [Agrobacterium tumefaciens]